MKVTFEQRSEVDWSCGCLEKEHPELHSQWQSPKSKELAWPDFGSEGGPN